jgi:hypothetical protein
MADIWQHEQQANGEQSDNQQPEASRHDAPLHAISCARCPERDALGAARAFQPRIA